MYSKVYIVYTTIYGTLTIHTDIIWSRNIGFREQSCIFAKKEIGPLGPSIEDFFKTFNRGVTKYHRGSDRGSYAKAL